METLVCKCPVCEVKRVAKAMYETPMEPGDNSSWPPPHPSDKAWWMTLARAAIKAVKERP